jgi:hypothetical protein
MSCILPQVWPVRVEGSVPLVNFEEQVKTERVEQLILPVFYSDRNV